MLVLFETPAGFALFKVLDEGKLDKVEDLWKEFETGDLARKIVKLKAFSKFENTAEALGAATLLVDSKPSKGLRKFLKAECQGELLAVADSKLGSTIKEKLKIDCIHNNGVMEMMRGLRSQLSELITGLAEQDIGPMSLGLSHSLSRYKLKFSPDKVDTMIIQAIGLLDDLDKELNTYAMRVREWYGWHFPELGKIIQDNILYAKVVKMMGHRTNAVKLDFSETFLTEDVEGELKEAAIISMGTEISDQDMANIKALCDQVIALSEYRAQLSEYLRNRMNAIAPNLTVLVGELVGARLIAHAGSLINLAKQPASTVQILGAEKALFRALKTKHQTPKYGLIFNASLVGQAAPKLKGKISRSLAAKSSISVRCDALGDAPDASIGFECRAKLETRLRQLEGRTLGKLSGTAKGKTKIEPYDPNRKQGAPGLVTAAKTYNPAADIAIGTAETPDKTGKELESKKKKKKKHQQQLAEDMIEPKEEPDAELIEEPVAKEVSEEEHAEDKTGKELESKKKKKKKHQHQLAEEMIEPKEEPDAELIEEPVVKVSEEEHAEVRTTKKKKTKHRESELKFEELEILETAMDGTEELALKKKKKKKEKCKATMEALQVFEEVERSVGLLKQPEGADIEVQVKRIKKKRKLESQEDPGETPGTSEKKKKKKKVKKEPEDVL